MSNEKAIERIDELIQTKQTEIAHLQYTREQLAPNDERSQSDRGVWWDDAWVVAAEGLLKVNKRSREGPQTLQEKHDEANADVLRGIQRKNAKDRERDGRDFSKPPPRPITLDKDGKPNTYYEDQDARFAAYEKKYPSC